jgi:hypothetical protein
MKRRGCAFLVLILLVVGVPLFLPVSVQACNISIQVVADGATLVSLSKEIDSTGDIVWDVAAENDLGSYIEKLIVTAKGDPWVSIEFGVRAGSADTTFNISSNIENINPAFTNPAAAATASITLTDRSQSTAGATITGLFDGGKIYQARYNGTSPFANLVDTFSFTRSGLNLSDVRAQSTGDSSIAGAVASIESQVNFTLSAMDSASGTTDFVVTPEPISLSLLAIGGAVLLRRKIR